ncbi:MAG: hypothetical protein HFF38_00855 [Lawsonibacter sp.]|nr:hypothetical protein [Lawsonibacter sp.]
MGKTVRFLFQFAWVNLASLLGFAAFVFAGCYLTGVPGEPGNSNLFANYYAMFPAMAAFCLFLFSFGFCTSNLQLGLSMGARRRDFFTALQGIILFSTAVCWALQLFMSAFPALAGWEVRDRWMLLYMFEGKPWAYPLLCFAVMVLGCLSGMLMMNHKGLGIVVVLLSILVLMGATIVLILSAETELMAFLYDSEWGWLWTLLPKGMAAVLAAAAVGGELLIWRAIHRFVVR